MVINYLKYAKLFKKNFANFSDYKQTQRTFGLPLWWSCLRGLQSAKFESFPPGTAVVRYRSFVYIFVESDWSFQWVGEINRALHQSDYSKKVNRKWSSARFCFSVTNLEFLATFLFSFSRFSNPNNVRVKREVTCKSRKL